MTPSEGTDDHQFFAAETGDKFTMINSNSNINDIGFLSKL